MIRLAKKHHQITCPSKRNFVSKGIMTKHGSRILTLKDAEMAVEHGVSGIIVSNHGARQLDTVPATIGMDVD